MNLYIVLEDFIFKVVIRAFVKACTARNITSLASVKFIEACFSKKNVLSMQLGWAMPTIELILQNEKVRWSIFLVLTRLWKGIMM